MKGDGCVKNKKVLIRAISFAFILTILFSIISVFALANGKKSYTPPANTSQSVIYADDVVRDYLGIAVSEAEEEYLNKHGDLSLSFPSHISTAYVDTSYSQIDKTLTVTARKYEYLSENGVFVCWTPVSVSLRGTSIALSTEENTAIFNSVNESEENKVSVTYRIEFVIDEETVNRLINLAYNDVPRLIEEDKRKKEETVLAREKYYKDLEAYEDYLIKLSEYESNLAVYKKYLSEKKVYDEKYLEYSQYLSELEAYNSQKIAYEEYLVAREKYYTDYAIYVQYLQYADKYQSKIEAYAKYVEKLEIIKSQLSVIDKAKTPVTNLNRTVYSAIMGDTVTSVIANKDAIANEIVGASAEAVDLAGVSTQNLRELLKDYFSIEDEREKYSYYTLNYEGFRDNFANLFRSLDKLYMNKRVRGILVAQDKQEKYIILLAQLYCITNALSDTPVSNFDNTGYFDSSYVVGKGYDDQKTPLEILGEIYIPDTNNSAPVNGGYPNPVEKPEYTLMTEPVMPPPVPIPTPPEAVDEPTAPEVVDEPIAPVTVLNPGDTAPSYQTPEEIVRIIAEYPSLSLREKYVGDLVVKREIVTEKTFINRNDVTVIYYDREYSEHETAERLYSTTVEKGTYADYLGSLPAKLEDSEAIYTFSHWTDKLGNTVDLTSVEADTELYPAFSKEYKSYDVVWVVNGVTYTENPGIPTKADNGKYYYEFSHWHTERDAITANVTYNAVFIQKHILPLYAGTGATVTVENGGYVADVGGYNGQLNIATLISKASQRGSLTIRGAKWEIYFSYSDVLSLKKAGADTLTFSAVLRSLGGYSYTYKLYDAVGTEITPNAKATVRISDTLTVNDALVVFIQNENDRSYVRHTADGSTVSFIAQPSRTYNATAEYDVGIIPSDLVTIKTDKVTANLGEYVRVEVSVPNGITLDGVYIVDKDGRKTYIDKGFEMCEGGVRLGVDAYRTEYTVSFISEDKVLLTYVLYYGDLPTPPTNPKKATNSKFSYTFIGWSGELSAVTEDVEFYAMYSSKRLPEKDESGLAITEGVLKILIPVVVVIAVLIIGITTLVCVLLMRHVRHRKNAKADKEKQNSENKE